MKLQIGSRGEEVKQLQQMLNYLGYNCGTADGIFGVKTESAVNSYKAQKYVNGIYDDNTSYLLVNDYNNKKSEEKDDNRIKILRRFDSDIYVFETREDEFVDIEIGQKGKLEPLSKITKECKEVIAKINAGFFNFDGSSEHLWGLIKNNKIIEYPDPNFLFFSYYKNGKVKIDYIRNPEYLFYLVNDIHWGFGVSYALVIDGKINLLNSNKIDHYKYKNPRTMLGIKKDSTFVLAVADGRRNDSKGLTAQEQAEVMLSLGCEYAINLDGGGSSEMIYNNRIINVLSDGIERNIGSAILVYKK